MVKRTLQNGEYKKRDISLRTARKLLCYKDHSLEISRGLTSEADLLPKDEITHFKESGTIQTPTPAIPVLVAGCPKIVNTEIVSTSKIADIPVTAKDVVLAIVSLKTDKVLGANAMEKTVKQLCGGNILPRSQFDYSFLIFSNSRQINTRERDHRRH
jgi:hypothetical protein